MGDAATATVAVAVAPVTTELGSSAWVPARIHNDLADYRLRPVRKPPNGTGIGRPGDSFPSMPTFSRDCTLMNIYVGNLAYSVTQDELREAFAEFGQVDSANLITDKFSGESKGFGFVEMGDNSEADAAIKALNDTALRGRKIRVNQAKPRGERPARSGGGGGGRW